MEPQQSIQRALLGLFLCHLMMLSLMLYRSC